jgi:predicted small secreted protein
MRSLLIIMRVMALPVIVMLGLASLTACNTVHGAGQDISSAGHAVQHGARSVQHSMSD